MVKRTAVVEAVELLKAKREFAARQRKATLLDPHAGVHLYACGEEFGLNEAVKVIESVLRDATLQKGVV